ncbi:hypothetical protein GGF44_002541 [Coemansia sp. RSA 1694]|nr:hypothetical protein GGF38_000777 [Coemansia sp. RSA 25]KAJ2640538.1 hypothetical protein GGF44_002541 [Coemansia sp. RSA 1694]
MSVDLFKMENILRVYIGLMWFYPYPPTDTLLEAVQQVQAGVNKVVAATPVLGGILRASTPVRIEYDEAKSKVTVESVEVPYTFAEIEQSGFDQNKYPLLFGAIPNITPDLEGLPVLKAWVFGLCCGGVVVAIASHHVLVDGAAAVDVATSIGRACIDPEFTPAAMWSSRDKIREMLTASIKGDEVVDDSYYRNLHCVVQNISSDGGGSLKTSGQARSHQFALKAESLRQLKELASQSADGDVCSTNNMVAALFWRAHARALAIHGSTSELTYAGGPKNLRGMLGVTNCLGNIVVLCPAYATKDVVLADQGLVPVAQVVQRFTRNGSTAGLLKFMDAMENDAPDILATLGATDSPSTAFSNMARMPVRQVDFGLGGLGSAQMRAFTRHYAVHIIDDGAGGFLANLCLPDSMLAAHLCDAEFTSYVDQVY